MGKLGKKARKFAKKNLQSVLRQKRKSNSFFKKKKSPRHELGNDETADTDATVSPNAGKAIIPDLEDDSLEIVPMDNSDVLAEEGSESDGYLSEDTSFLTAVEIGGDQLLEETVECGSLSMQNEKIQSEVENQTKKLENLKKKHHGFSSFLEKHMKNLEALEDEDMESGEVDEDDKPQLRNGEVCVSSNRRLHTRFIVNNWSQLVEERKDTAALPYLLNTYRSACHYGVESSSDSRLRLQDHQTFCSIVMFMLQEGDNIFKSQLGIPITNGKTGTIQKLVNTSKWKNMKPLIKSYLRSTLFFLTHITDPDIMVYVVTRLRASMLYFREFPSLLHKLTQVAVGLWVTGPQALSYCAFLILSDVASAFESNFYDDCLRRMYKAFLSSCRAIDPVNMKHIHYMRDLFIQFCSIDPSTSISMSLVSVQRLAGIFQRGLLFKKKEALKKLCSWEYVLAMDLWVMFASANVKDSDLQGLLFTMIQIINGMTQLFPGPRYLPLRVKCIQWLNHISSSSGMFIPVSSLILDLLEHRTMKEGGKSGKVDNFPNALKLPKHLLKSSKFLEECAVVAIELLSTHFSLWSSHISFPELATFPIIRLRKFLETSTDESLHNGVKRLIEQVEKNIDFVQRKRDDVSFTPKDKDSVNSFVQDARSGESTPYSQYYRAIIEKAASRNLFKGDSDTRLAPKGSKKMKVSSS